jgi:transcriptional regulator with GAF, ATPase, and Fis domain
MESTRSNRFDPNFVTQLLLDVAHEKSLAQLLEKIVNQAVLRPDMACAQIWLIEKGDRCAVCPRRAECLDQTRCLHQVAGKGSATLDSQLEMSLFFDPLARIPLGVGFLGSIAVSGEQQILKNLDKDPSELTEFNFLEKAQICGCGITPIIFKDEVLGLMLGLTRENLPDEARPWGRIFANHIGAAIANTRAFEEIQRLKAQLELQNVYLQEEVVEAKAFGSLVGQSGALKQIISQIDLVAPTEASVLILGETGTGKELVAHEIHRRSQRKNRPMVRVNCASIPKDLFESEFFGHIKGAFTGAVKDRAGRFETAEGGTLLLDEIGEIPLEMQSKLLRVLQEKSYERVGDDRTRFADVRIIAATNQDLKKAVASGNFREDLYYRFHVFPIQVEPLRQRKDDIPLLAKHFVDLSVRELKCAKPRLTKAGMSILQSYDWPGNIRELRNIIERAVILARGGVLQFDLPILHKPIASALDQPITGTTAQGYLTEIELQQRERDNLLLVLEKTGWKIKGEDGAAELIGIKPTTLLSRMKKMGLNRRP